MPEVVIAKPREGKFNKNAARRVRVAGKIPAVLYGAGARSSGRRGGSEADFADPVFRDRPQHHFRCRPGRQIAGQGHDRGLAAGADQGHADPHRPEADRHGQGSARERAREADGHAGGREDRGRHSGPGAARSGNRVPALGHSQPHRRGREQPGTCSKRCA